MLITLTLPDEEQYNVMLGVLEQYVPHKDLTGYPGTPCEPGDLETEWQIEIEL